MSADPTIAAGAGATAADAAAVNAATVEAAVAGTAPGAPVDAPTTSGYAVKPLYLTAPFAMLVLFVVWTAIPSFLIPVQVQAITGETDASSLAFASVFGSVAAMIGNPVFGRLSDRTRSRFGRRTPWIAVCGIIGALVVFLQGSASSIVMLGVCWAATNLILNGFQAAFVATVPDRVPRNRLGVMSSLIGAGLNAGVLVGSLMFVFFPQLASSAGYTVLAVLIVIATLLFVLVSPDRDSREQAREPFRLGEFLRGFWVSPRTHPDFAWVFLSRVAIMLGYFMLFAFLLFAMQDYIGLSPDEALQQGALVFTINGACSIVGSLVSAPFADKPGRLKGFVLVAGLLLAVSLTVPLFSATLTGMMVFAVLNGFAFGLYMAVDTALVNKVLPVAADAGKDLGIMNVAMVLPQVISAVVGAAVVALVGYWGLFLVASIIAIIGAVAVLPVRKI